MPMHYDTMEDGQNKKAHLSSDFYDLLYHDTCRLFLFCYPAVFCYLLALQLSCLHLVFVPFILLLVDEEGTFAKIVHGCSCQTSNV